MLDMLRGGRRLATTVSLSSCLLLAGFAGTALASDYDADGSSTPADCNDFDAAIHPGAVDKPDLAFEDTNCDGIDGDVNQAIFVDGGGGLDTRSGTRDFPKKTISNAIVAAKAAGKDVYVAAGTYPELLTLDTGVSIFGGYTPNFSARTTVEQTTVTAIPQAALADGKTAVTLQLLTLLGGTATTATGGNSYGLRVINGAKVALDHVIATGGTAIAGAAGSVGAPGSKGNDGTVGGNGSCGSGVGGTGPAGGTGVNNGGKGGNGGGPGGNGATGGDGAPSGSVGTGGPLGGGSSGSGNITGGGGSPGKAGSTGSIGSDAPFPAFTLDLARATWSGVPGEVGGPGGNGTGGGGGGGGGGASVNGLGYQAGGGSGGSGGAGSGGGSGGKLGDAGYGSFGVYIYKALVVARDSALRGGAGGNGGNGGPGGDPGTAGAGGGGGSGASGGIGTGCGDGLAFTATGGHGGKGGDGGKGGSGGKGSGGTGGPSAGVFRSGADSFYSQRATTQAGGTSGTGGRLGGTGQSSAGGQSAGLLQAAGVGTAAGDFDGDGVTDPLDDCPTVAAVATINGCPARPAKLVDTDHDGIPDTNGQGTPIDKCPTVAPAPGTDANGDGCPDPVATASPTPTATATATPIQQPNGGSTPPPSTGAAGPAPASVEQVVITVTYFANSGKKSSKFTSLKVRNVPLGATVNVTCKGSGCPKGLKGKGFTKKNAFGSVDLKTFIKKPLKVGLTITVVVSKPNAINAVKILKIRKSKAPTITTRCIRPGSTAQVACA